MHYKHKIAFTLACLVLLTAISLNITTIYPEYDSGKDLRQLADGVSSKLMASEPISSDDLKGMTIKINPPYKPTTIDADELGNSYEVEVIYAPYAESDTAMYYMKLIDLGLISYDDAAYLFSGLNLKKFIDDNKDLSKPELANKLAGLNELSPLMTKEQVQKLVSSKLNSLGPEGKDLGFSRAMKYYIAAKNAGIQDDLNDGLEEQGVNPGQAFKKLLEKISGYFTFDACKDISQMQSSDFQYGDVGDDAVTPICSGDQVLNTAINLFGSLNNPNIKSAIICEPGTVIKAGNMKDYAIKIASSSVIIKNCKFEGFHNVIIDDGGLNSNIEIINNEFTDSKAVNLLNLNTFGGQPTLKIMGNTFKSTSSFGKVININNFNGEILISDNTFENSGVVLKGSTDQGASPSATILKNKFDNNQNTPNINKISSISFEASSLSKGLVQKNDFNDAVSAVELAGSSDVIVLSNSFNAMSANILDNNGQVTNDYPRAIGVGELPSANIIIKNNYLDGFGTAMSTSTASSSMISSNTLHKNKLVMNLGMLTDSWVIGNDFTDNSGFVEGQDKKLLNILSSKENLFISNKFDEDSGDIYLEKVSSPSSDNIFYNVSSNRIKVLDGSSAHLYYPVTFDVKNTAGNDVDFANVELIDKDNVVVAASTYKDWPKLGYYIFSHTKLDAVDKNVKYPFTANVYIGNDEKGTAKLHYSKTLAKLESETLITAPDYDKECVPLPTVFTLTYKQFDPILNNGQGQYNDIILQGQTFYYNVKIDKDTTLCPGLYELNDADGTQQDSVKGVISFNPNALTNSPITLKCDNTILKSKTDKSGVGLFIGKDSNNLVVNSCEFRNYNQGVLVEGSKGNEIKNNRFVENNYGLQLNYENTINDDSNTVQADIVNNEFTGNIKYHLLFYNPAASVLNNGENTIPGEGSDDSMTSFVYNNKFLTKPSISLVSFKMMEYPFDTQIMLYKEGMGNYWVNYGVSDNPNLWDDKYVNKVALNADAQYIDPVYTDQDKASCTIPNFCDGFWDKPHKLLVNFGTETQGPVYDYFPYSSPDFVGMNSATDASVEITLNAEKELVAAVKNAESSITGISYNWLSQPQDTQDIQYTPLAVLNYPMSPFKTVQGKEYKILEDFSGNVNNAKVFGTDAGTKAEIVQEGIGNSIILSETYLELGSSAINIDHTFTIEMLFKYMESSGETDLFVNKYFDQEKYIQVIDDEAKLTEFLNDYNKNLFNIKIMPVDDKLMVEALWLADKDGNPVIIPEGIDIPAFEIKKDKWNYLVATFDGTKLSLYLNDKESDFFTYTPQNKLNLGTGPYFLGPYILSGFVNAQVTADEFKLYDKVLSNEQIKANYDSYFNADGTLKAKPSSSLPLSNKLVKEEHNTCGNWQVQAFLTDENGYVFTSQALSAVYDKMPCGKKVCNKDLYPGLAPEDIITCPSPQICNAQGFCEFKSCTPANAIPDDAIPADPATGCGAGEVCEFGKCLKCKEPADDMVVDQFTVLCPGKFNVVDAAHDGVIKISEDNTKLKCLEGTEIIGPNKGYDITLAQPSIGVVVSDTKNVEISGCKLKGFSGAIDVETSEKIILKYNKLTENTYGLTLRSGEAPLNASLTDNILEKNMVGALISGNTINAVNTNLTNNQFNIMFVGSVTDTLFKNCYVNESKFIKQFNINVVGQAPEIINTITSAQDLVFATLFSDTVPVSEVTFKDVFFDTAYFPADSLPTDPLSYKHNTTLNIYWSLNVNVIDSAKNNLAIDGATVEVFNKGKLVDLNENGVSPENADVLTTDEEGWTHTYLLSKVTDKSMLDIVDIGDYSVLATNPKVPSSNAKAKATSSPFKLEEPKTLIMDLDAGSELVINANVVSQSQESSKKSGGGSPKYEGTCKPEYDAGCKKKYSYTPCVKQGNLSYATKVFTCNTTNKCGVRLFVEPCEGNAPSFSSGCSNQVKDIFEDGIDCGGPCQTSCPASCEDNMQNQGETDVDCGGNKCSACLDDRKCSDDSDCISEFCKNGWCKQPTCYDNYKNQDEEEVDCGGSCKKCGAVEEAAQPTCFDGIKNQGETGTDCGGPCQSCTPQIQQPKRFSDYLKEYLYIGIIALITVVLLLGGYIAYSKSKPKKIPPMSKISSMSKIPLMSKTHSMSKPGSAPLDAETLRNDLADGFENELSSSLGDLGDVDKDLNIREAIKELSGLSKKEESELKNKIKSLLEQHHSKAEIIELLKADYPAPEEYPEHAVKYLFENCMHEFLPSNVEEQLKKYINHYYAKGMSKAALKKVLVDAGWSKKIIDKMLKMEEEEE